jgi:deoxyribodipyrimidine photo-lyase
MNDRRSIFWMRRDLRAHDNVALHAALSASDQVICVFVYDRTILDELPRADRRVAFIHASVEEAGAALAKIGGKLLAVEGDPAVVIPELARRFDAARVFANDDYEPPARRRDAAVAASLEQEGRELVLSKDQVLLHKDEVLSKSGTPYTRFSPYYNAWLQRLGQDAQALRDYDTAALKAHFGAPPEGRSNIPLEELGFDEIDLESLSLYPGTSGAYRVFDEFMGKVDDYMALRNTLALPATSGLDIHLRFGTMSIREIFRGLAARKDVHEASVAGWIREVCWREYFSQLMYHVPRVAEGPYIQKYAQLEWVDGAEGDALFEAWTNAATGYPIVDAAMTQLNTTGAMHNRARLVAGSFLVKTLGVDWRHEAERLRPRVEQRQLAVGRIDGRGCPAAIPDLQSLRAIEELRPGRPLHQALPAGAGARRGAPPARTLETDAAGTRLSRADRGPGGVRRGVQAPLRRRRGASQPSLRVI